MNYSNINNTEHFIKFKKPKFNKIGKGIGKVGKGIGKVGKGVVKTGTKFQKKMNPINQMKDLGKSLGIGGTETKIISYVCSVLICLILIAYILFQLKR